MGCTVRERNLRNYRKLRSALRPDADNNASVERIPVPCVFPHELSLKPSSDHHHHHHHVDVDVEQHNNRNPNPSLDESGWGYCTEEQLEELLMKNLQFLYNEAIAKLVALGYDEDVALKAVLRNGHCYGGMDVLTNILHNSLAYLNSSVIQNPLLSYKELKQLEEYSLAGMVCLLQQVKPHLSKGDAMWCLLMSDLHVGRASTMEIPVLPSSSNCNGPNTVSNGPNGVSNAPNGVSNGPNGVSNAPNGVSNGPNGVSNVPNGVSNAPNGVSNAPNGVSNGPNGVSNAPNGVSNAPNGVSNDPNGVSNGEDAISNQIGFPPGLCKFHGGWGFGGAEICEFPMSGSFASSFDARMVRNFECPKRFNLTPSMKSLLQRNVNMFAAGFRANKSQVCPSTLSSGESPTVVPAGSELPSEKFQEPRSSKNAEVSSVMSSLGNLSLDDKPDGGISEKGEDLLNLAHRIRDLEGQVKDRKEWAHQKALQAARKLSHDLTELKMLRMEREETQRLKKGKQTLEDTTMKRLSEMENALRKASGQVDRANTAVRRLENENAEIRAEMEASKLSASESVKTCLEVAKREKKCLKRLLAWEKQKTKLQEEVAEEKQKISQFQQQMLHIKEAQKETEAKWKEEVKNKELAMTQVEEERRSKESTEVNVKRKQEVLRRKVEIDFQRHKDDIERLEQELSRLRSSAESIQLNCTTNALAHEDSEVAKPHRETHTRSLNDLSKLQDSSDKGGNYDRECLICMKDEVSVVFLPCAHQVLCANCNEDYGKKGKATCPSCRVQIEQRINVYGASS